MLLFFKCEKQVIYTEGRYTQRTGASRSAGTGQRGPAGRGGVREVTNLSSPSNHPCFMAKISAKLETADGYAY